MSRYERLLQLERGPLTRAFLARRRGSPAGRLWRLELLREDAACDSELRALFLERAAASVDFEHPELPVTWEVVSEGQECGFASEFLEGRTLASVLSRIGRARVPVDLQLHIVSRVLDAIVYMQREPQASALHGDLCPDNVLVAYDGQIKLLGAGFGGVTRALEARVGRCLTDPRYTAPEVLLGSEPDARADVYAAGVMLWEALARQPRQQTPLEDVWPEAPEALIALCQRALAVDPHERFSSAEALQTELRRHLARATDPSALVLARLPALLEAPFRAERDELSRMVRARLGRAPDGAAVASAAVARTPPPAETPSRRDADTGGHRAYSSSLEPPAAAQAPGAGLRPAAWLVAAGLGAVMATAALAVLQRAGEPRARRPARDAAQLVRSARPPLEPTAPPPVARALSMQRAPETLVEDAPAAPAPPAFFEERATVSGTRCAPCSVAPDELPVLDPARDALQEAIVRAARRALQRRPVRKPALAAAEVAVSAAPAAAPEPDLLDPPDAGPHEPEPADAGQTSSTRSIGRSRTR